MPQRKRGRDVWLYVLTLTVAALAAACADAPPPRVGDDAVESETVEVSTRAAGTPSASADPPPSGATSEVDPCSLLNAADLQDLAGERVSSPTQTDFQGIPQCRWGEVGATLVQVQAAPSADWSVSVEAIIGQLAGNPSLSADDVKEVKQAQAEMSKRGALNARQACGVFSMLAEIGGAPDGATDMVSYLPAGEGSVAVTGQKCTDGRFTSVALQKPGLQESPKLAERVSAALSAAHSRAVATGR